jgi:hypothetical protein
MVNIRRLGSGKIFQTMDKISVQANIVRIPDNKGNVSVLIPISGE